MRDDLSQGPLHGHCLKITHAPLKLLASRLGLVRYGRNNLSYAPDVGSYVQLLGYLTDAPLPIDSGWVPFESRMLDECSGCRICEALCPTGAIGGDRVLLRAERCLTLATETPGPWPAYARAGSQDCMIGCLLCQRYCPVNPELQVIDTGVVFGETETMTLFHGGEQPGRTWDDIRRKFAYLGRPYEEGVYGRNLRALVRAHPEEASRGTILPCDSAR